MVRVTIMGSRELRHRTGCCGSRTQEEIVLGFIPTLYRMFGQRHIHCSYLDVDDPGALEYPAVVEAVKNKEMGLPLAIRDGQVVLHGHATLYQLPDYIRQALKEEKEQEQIRAETRAHAKNQVQAQA